MQTKPSIFFTLTEYKILFTLVLSVTLSLSSFAQRKEKKQTKAQITTVSLKKYIQNKPGSFVITSQHTSKQSGITHTYLRQALNGIEVFGTESSMHTDASGKVVVEHNKFIDNIQSLVRSASPSFSAKQAILKTAQKMGYSVSGLTEKEKIGGTNQKTIFNGGGISGVDIPVQLQYYFEEGKGIRLAWELSIQDVNSSDWYNFRVDANTGEILHKENWTIECFTENTSVVGTTFEEPKEEKLFYTVENNPALIGSYNVFPIPVESPNFGTRSNVVNPDNATASPYGWHDTNGIAGAEYTYTRGNNADAYDDDNGSNSGTVAKHADGGAGLNFDFPFNPVYSAGDQSEKAAVTNLFFWTNIMHDVMYLYGFDEASGNFQENNYGNGGTASDSVWAEAQDGGGTCNANFATPTDGSNPRTQMYICNSRDGDVDNGVIAHEYGHGISTRLTGGAGNSSCLNNEEQMGEGWSDFFGLVLTIEPGDAGTDSRGIGTWLIGEGPNGAGIRTYPYSTDFAVNPHTYDAIKTEVAPHGVGSVWAAMLWEMTWDLIAVHGFDPDVYNGTGGNNIALQLVIEGLKLQPCSPGFVDGRDAILQADQNLYGGANQCTIWQAFARRGLGYSAVQGSTSSKTDGTEAFDLPPGTAAFTVSTNQVCQTQGTQNGLGGGVPTGGTYSGLGVTDDGNGTTFTFDPVAAGTGTITVTYTVNDACSGGVANKTDTIEVTDGNPLLVCKNATVTLDGSGNAIINQADVVANLLPSGAYTIDQTGTFAPIDISTGAVNLSLGDDSSSNVTLGFTFNFFGTDFTAVNVSSNGYLSFSASGLTEYTNDTLPDVAVPQNVIAVAWDDLDPTSGGIIRYKIVGTAPNRIMIIEYNNVPHYGNAGITVTTQVQLYEGSNKIEIHSTNIQSDGGIRTQGIENGDGTTAYTPTGRNNTDWTATNDYVAFIPVPGNLADNCGNTVTISLSDSTFTCRDIGDNLVTVTADDGNGGVSTCVATVTVVGPTSTFSAGTWDVAPNAGRKALFNDNYSTATSGDVTACSCEIASGNTVTVTAGNFLNIDGDITVNGSLIVDHQGSVVQVNPAATVTNNGTINVKLTTPNLASRDFMVMGSPMTAETRNGVFNSAFLVLNHTTENFVPNPAVAAAFPAAENFADDNYDNWNAYTGAITPGEGYIVRPQAGYGQPGGVFNMTYQLGTLNNGTVNFNVVYNTSKNDSPNVLANPYASAIFADDFINANAMIDEVYFWEHLTPPSPTLPGAGAMNFSMEDISMYNLLGGTPAASDPGTSTTPNGYIATGQGFGIKATAAGTASFTNTMRRTTGNNTLRNPVDKDRIWLTVRNSQYEMQNTTLVGFTDVSTQGFDNGYDSRRLATVVSLYSHLPNGDMELGIQAREAFNEDIEIPMGFSTLIDETIEYKISIADIQGANLEQVEVYLVDTLTGIVTNLNEDSYSFTSGKATYNNRFILQFKEPALGTTDFALEQITLFPNPTNGNLTIVSPKTPITQITVMDVRGRTVQTHNGNQANTVNLSLENLENAMYFITVQTQKGSLTKRLIKN